MKNVIQERPNFESLIEKAKLSVIKSYERGATTTRPWHTVSTPNSYGDPACRVTLMVLSGSPPKGFVLVNYARQTAVAMDAWHKIIHIYTVW